MNFTDIFNVFSRRSNSKKKAVLVVPITLRNKVLMLCRDTLYGTRKYGGYISYPRNTTWDRFWEEIHYALTYRHGRPMLIPGETSLPHDDDALTFLMSCSAGEFLDFIELIFKTQIIARVCIDENLLVADINALMQTENAGYELTNIVIKPASDSDTRVHFIDYGSTQIPVNNVIAFPQIILKEDQVVHGEIIKPILNLLSDVRFANANKEYLEALEDYRKGDYGDCLTKCCSSFESVMKIICAQKGWRCNANDPADKLIQMVVSMAGLESYFVQPLMIIATLRNRLSKSHGAGLQMKDVPQYTARYALNASASAMTLLIDATK